MITKKPDAIFVYCRAGMKKTNTEIGSAFTNKTGIPAVFNFPG